MNALHLPADGEIRPVQLHLDLTGGRIGEAPLFRRSRRRGVHRCESPVERQLAFAFTRLKSFEWRSVDDHVWLMGRWSGARLELLAQPDWFGFRPDFALVRPGWRAEISPEIVVEVDGHDFHERTPEQAERDRRRDRLMTERGAKVLRFTGREVYRNARDCALEVLEYATRQ